jgi:hypothetical protein
METVHVSETLASTYKFYDNKTQNNIIIIVTAMKTSNVTLQDDKATKITVVRIECFVTVGWN